jgi:hypothetical protein
VNCSPRVQHPWGHFFVGNNWFKNFPQHVLEMAESEGTTFSVVYKYNLIWNGGVLPAHLNYLQFGGGHATSVDVEYNTGYQTNLSGGETFQFYDYAGGSIDSSTFAYNIIIARGGAQGSHLGPGIAHDNYFDASASWGAFYNGSFNGWTITNNCDMVTGTRREGTGRPRPEFKARVTACYQSRSRAIARDLVELDFYVQ